MSLRERIGNTLASAKLAAGLELAAVAIASAAGTVSAVEIGTHANETCVAYEGAAAIALHEVTGEWPGWTPHEYNPDLTGAQEFARIEYLLNGGSVPATLQPSRCF
jgi:hypothetical protein